MSNSPALSEDFWKGFCSEVAKAYGIPDEAENLYQGSRFIRLKEPRTSPARSPNVDTT